MVASQAEYLKCKSICKPVSRENGYLITGYERTTHTEEMKCLSKWFSCYNHSKFGISTYIGTVTFLGLQHENGTYKARLRNESPRMYRMYSKTQTGNTLQN